MNLKRTKLDNLWLLLEELQDFKASQESALLEFKYGDWYGPTAEQLKWARSQTQPDISHQISSVMCEIERREPGTFITY